MEINEHTLAIVAIAYLESHQEELNEFLKDRPDIFNDFSDYLLQCSDSADDDTCSDIEEYVEYYYWEEFVKFHNSYIPLMK